MSQKRSLKSRQKKYKSDRISDDDKQKMPHHLSEINESVQDAHVGDKIGFFVEVEKEENIPAGSKGLYLPLNRPNSYQNILEEIASLKKSNEDIRVQLAELKLKELVLAVVQAERAMEIGLIQWRLLHSTKDGSEITRLEEAIKTIRSNIKLSAIIDTDVSIKTVLRIARDANFKKFCRLRNEFAHPGFIDLNDINAEIAKLRKVKMHPKDVEVLNLAAGWFEKLKKVPNVDRVLSEYHKYLDENNKN